jgi:hypothetical protein
MIITHTDRGWHDGDSPEERIDDSDRDLPLPEDHPSHAVSLSTESADSRLQAWQRMAIRTFGSGTMDPRPDSHRRELLN